uniref:Pectate lyase superfamily protein domain-containing protein n=1 Tax=Leersia perrieri TaxID=77586 RepID=A0A0D9WJ99_9ORYZ
MGFFVLFLFLTRREGSCVIVCPTLQQDLVSFSSPLQMLLSPARPYVCSPMAKLWLLPLYHEKSTGKSRMALAAAGVLLLLIFPYAAESRVLLSLDDFGAVGDGVANDTQALLDAWTAACSTGEHVFLHVPAAKSYLIWPLTLAGPCREEIKLFISGNIVAPESPEDWPAGGGEWLHFRGVSDLALTGGGVIDGRGHRWWARSCKSKHNATENCTSEAAPKALHFENCQDVSVMGITVQNSQQSHLTFTRCSHVKANYLRITSPEDSPDTIGVQIVSSRNVHIMDDLISTGHDCVSIVGNSTDVRLRAISCGPGHGISIGALGENRSYHRVEKIKMDTLFISNTENGVRVKTWQGGCGTARKMKFGDILMKNVTNPIVIDQHYSSSNEIPCSSKNGSAVAVGEISYMDIAGTSASERAVTFACSDASPCSKLSMENVNITMAGGQNASAYCHQAFGKTVGVVVPDSCLAEEDFLRQRRVPAAAAAEEEGGEDDGDGEDDQ